MSLFRVKEGLRRAAASTRRLRAEGQGLVEYALIIMFVGMVVLVILYFVGPAVGNIFSNLIPATLVRNYFHHYLPRKTLPLV